jgi:MSHA biogenesis protein MshL
VTTNQEATFWSDLCEALVALTFPADEGQKQAAQEPATVQGAEDRQRGMCNRRHAGSDRSIVVTPQSGVIVVRATPAELRSVENYLRATRLAVERQVMLEAKIIEVTLSDQYQSGINWAIFNRQGAIGQVTRPAGQTQLAPDQTVRSTVRNAAASQILNGPSGAVVGLAVASPHFGALLTFLETQGKVQVLSSPRVATLNNQKAVLKVGTDQLFVSNVTVTPPTATVAGTVSTATTIAPQFSPYFSGIVLDVTPQIDDRGNITLHIHPTINDITPTPLTIDFGLGPVNLPTASNSIRETDTIVRVSDGNIVAIGGLMQTQVNDTRGGIPGVSDSGPAGLFLRSTNRLVQKKELVILLKPTVVESDGEWTEDLRETRERVDALGREMGTRIGQ